MASSRLLWVGGVLPWAIAIACGGSGTATNTNTGGTSSGATGGGGSGGSTGGVTGGGSGGVPDGGAGGATGGGTGGAGTGGSVGAICAKLEPLACFGNDCPRALLATAAQAAATGCKAQASAAFECIEGDTPFCDATKAQVQYGSACQTAIDAYHACLQGSSQCIYDGFLGSCLVLCGSSWGAQCSLLPGEPTWDCLCRVGPHIGTKFTLALTDKCSETLSAEHCAP